jgi:prevent-host-death family protein
MKRIALSEARDRLSSLVNEVAHGKQRVVLESHGRAKAAIVAISDLERLEADEDPADGEAASMLHWLRDAERHLAEAKTSGAPSVEALREVREHSIGEATGVYRRKRRTEARRRRRR